MLLIFRNLYIIFKYFVSYFHFSTFKTKLENNVYRYLLDSFGVFLPGFIFHFYLFVYLFN